MASDEAFLTVRVDDDLDGAGKNDVEIVGGVSLPIEVLTGRHSAANTELRQRRDFCVAQLREGICVSSHEGTPSPYPFAF